MAIADNAMSRVTSSLSSLIDMNVESGMVGHGGRSTLTCVGAGNSEMVAERG